MNQIVDNHESRCSGFSLVELLVALVIIAVLIALMFPVFARARDLAKDTVCLNNNREFGVAFGAYAADFDCFPIDAYDSHLSVMYLWGGVDWYLDGADLPSWMYGSRPLNKYVGAQRQHRGDLDLFRCPRDDGMRYTKSDAIIDWQVEFGSQTIDPEGPMSVYSVLGNSYGANGWMYCQPGSNNGIGPYPDFPKFRTDLGPDDVETVPSRFVIVCGQGPTAAGRYPLERRMAYNIVYGWWHGYEIGQMAFLDGSARAEKMPGEVTTQSYTFFMAPERHSPSSYRQFDRP